MRDKQGELETLVLSQNYEIIHISDTWWNKSCEWSAGVEGYQLFRRDRQCSQGGDTALCWN